MFRSKNDAIRLHTRPIYQRGPVIKVCKRPESEARPRTCGTFTDPRLLCEDFGQAHAPNDFLDHLEPRGRPPAGPHYNTGVAREQKNLTRETFQSYPKALGCVNSEVLGLLG